jgi:Flp pilus assembly protein protease CpaA
VKSTATSTSVLRKFALLDDVASIAISRKVSLRVVFAQLFLARAGAARLTATTSADGHAKGYPIRLMNICCRTDR